ncbi:MAG TPA: hypothetical protein VGU02_08850 [Gaiellaceae bacterium]|nr:hypothetical protein [Gaiellaceae bacterium]
MGVFNRRNAAVGWLAWAVGKRVIKKKAKDAVPSVDPETKRPNKSAVALAVAGLVGALTFWRNRSGDSTDSTE